MTLTVQGRCALDKERFELTYEMTYDSWYGSFRFTLVGKHPHQQCINALRNDRNTITSHAVRHLTHAHRRMN